MKRNSFCLTVLSGAGLLLNATAASAAGFMVRENSAESLATIYAGNGSRADEPATVFNNPAGMSWLQGTQFELGSAVVIPSMKFSGSSSIAGISLPGDNSKEIGQFAAIPHFYGVFDLGERWKAGIAITVPFGN